MNPDSEVTRQQTVAYHCAIRLCPYRAAVCFYPVTQGDGASAFALGCYASAFQAVKKRFKLRNPG